MPNPQGHNGKLPTPPEQVIRPHIERYLQLRVSYPAMAMKLRKHYDTTKYSMGLESLKKKCREWGISRARGQGHTTATIAPAVEATRTRFPNAGMRDMKSLLHHEQGIEVSEKTVLRYMKAAHPDEVARRLAHRGGMVRKNFWAAGVNDIWTFDQHDKLKRFYLYLHMCCEPVSGYVVWLKIWWTNRNPRLINSYYCDAVEEHGGCPMITQSDRGTENNGIANSQTTLRQFYDSSLQGTLQHKWMAKKGQNIKPEIFWSELRRRWSPGFEQLLQHGVTEGLYDPEDYVSRMLFYYLFIPYLQGELDVFRERYNSTKKRRDKHKILPHGQPALIFQHPQEYGWEDFKILVEPEKVAEVRERYSAPPDDPVFQLVPPAFEQLASEIYTSMGKPSISHESIWTVYVEMLTTLQVLTDIGTLTWLADLAANSTEAAFAGDEMPVLPCAQYRTLGMIPRRNKLIGRPPRRVGGSRLGQRLT
ncbi:hypothetical protein C8Q78DRAFT_1072612 [Trametes maxima]|nr:hypothetical protein C8Q78DRAFT_1072612 [Trametes maxima]